MKGELHIEEHDSSTLSAATAPRVVSGPRPRPLSFWREKLALTGGYVTGPDGERHAVSLEPWADADENTMLAIYVKWIDPDLVGTIDPRATGR